MVEFRIDDCEEFIYLIKGTHDGGFISVRFLGVKRLVIIICHDECVKAILMNPPTCVPLIRYINSSQSSMRNSTISTTLSASTYKYHTSFRPWNSEKCFCASSKVS